MSDFKEWDKDDGYKQLYNDIKSLYEKEKIVIEGCTNNEAELERIFIRPILEMLSFKFSVQSPILDSAKRPDYALFKTDEDRTEAFNNEDSPDFYCKAICVADAKAWDKNLDRKDGTQFTNQNPSYQIDYYLRETNKKWGILTNGRKWRLYFEEESHRLDTYYEVDLVKCLESKPEEFKYFYFFFRKDAFIHEEKSFLYQAYNQSGKYSQSVGENLEENIYKALLWMAKGYFAVKTNKLEINEENLKEVHSNSLIFLYRLLFVLYVESKGLIETGKIPRKYQDYNITTLIDEILEKKDDDTLNPVGGLYAWKFNDQIFKLIDQGSKAMGIPESVFTIPAYNGGLFSNEKHPFLAPQDLGGKKIQDKYLAQVIDLVTRSRSPEHKGKGRIDYADLSIRHLGGIYEGLLEYKLKIAEEDIVPVKQKGKLMYITLEEARDKNKVYSEDEIVKRGDVYLVTDKGERKATGSYYTPDYIVKYIVENTVGPVLDEKLKKFKTSEEKKEAILSTKVLDPAMGSGHFLVEATTYIATRLAEVTEPEEGKRDIDLAKREVVKHCIYGVDLNPLAVELAKLSLWLTTLSEDKPLSFLDHHLKIGNSLIGADLYKLDKHPKEKVKEDEKPKKKQMTLEDIFNGVGEGKSKVDVKKNMQELLKMYKRIMERKEEKPDDIKAQEKIFHEFEDFRFRKRFKTLADVHTSYHFRNEFTEEQYHELLKELPPGSDWDNVVKQDWITNSIEISNNNHFFHWQLEFPEIFFDISSGKGKENPGFDAVVGNPPYVSIEKIDKTELVYFENRYISASYGRTDLYLVFIELSDLLSRKKGAFSMITPDKWLVSNYGEILRQSLLTKSEFIDIWDLRKVKVFQDATNSPIVFVNRQIRPDDNVINFIIGLPGEKEYSCLQTNQSLFLQVPQYKIKIGLTEEKWRIVKKMDCVSDKVMDFCYTSYGAQPGLLSKFVFYDKESAMEGAKRLGEEQNFLKILKPFIKGGNVSRFEIKHDGGLILYLPNKLHRPAFSELFENEKIVISEISNHLKGTYDDKAFYGNEKVVFVISGWSLQDLDEGIRKQRKIPEISALPKHTKNYNLNYVISLINSKLMDFYFITIVGDLLNVYPDDVRQLPIRTINFITPEDHRKALTKKAVQLYNGHRDTGNFTELRDFCEACLPKDKGGNFITKKEQSDVVHDLLAYLAEQMIEMNKEKQKDIKQFLEYLEYEIGTEIDSLKNKTKINTFYDLEFNDFLNIMKENKSKISIDPSDFESYKLLKEGFEKSNGQLHPLIKKINDTDNLIDQIVYKLYGLTEEEIGIVEGET